MINKKLYFQLKKEYCKITTAFLNRRLNESKFKSFFEEIGVEKFAAVKFKDLNTFNMECILKCDREGIDIKEVSEITKYTPYFQGKVKNPIFNKLNIKVCPYCDANKLRITTYENSADNFTTRNSYQLDHFLPKKHNTFVALSFENLIPCCQPCNAFKGNKRDTIKHPFFESDNGPSLEFDEVSLIKNFYNLDGSDIKLNYKNRVNDFFLIKNSLEQNSQSELKELILKKRIFTQKHIQSIRDNHKNSLVGHKLKDVIFGGSINVFGSSQKTLSRITASLIDELDIPDPDLSNNK